MVAKFAKFNQGTPPPGYVDTEIIRLTRDGIWLADGEEISHEPTRRLFARSLKKDEKGYFLHIGREMRRIEVEDTAYFVEGLEGRPPPVMSFGSMMVRVKSSIHPAFDIVQVG